MSRPEIIIPPPNRGWWDELELDWWSCELPSLGYLAGGTYGWAPTYVPKITFNPLYRSLELDGPVVSGQIDHCKHCGRVITSRAVPLSQHDRGRRGLCLDCTDRFDDREGWE